MVSFLKCKTFSSCLVENKTKPSGYWAKIYIRSLCKQASNKYVNPVIFELIMLGGESLFYKNGLMIENPRRNFDLLRVWSVYVAAH